MSDVSFCPVASGSNGNCIYVSSGNTRILIDAGLSGVKIEARLNGIGATCIDIDAIFVTHEHSDHTMGIGVLSRRFDTPIYATPGTWQALERDKYVGRISPKNKRFVYSEESLMLNDLCVKPFTIPHDAREPVGYTIHTRGRKVSVATDLGCITPDVTDNIKDSDILLLEANHDEDMVINGRYPEILKKRILGMRGHLSNVNCGRLLAEVMCDRLRHIYLGHLSEENNIPLLAYETVKNILTVSNFKVNESFQLHLTDRSRAGELLSY